MKYTFSEYFGSGWKSSHYVEFDIDLSDEEVATVVSFLKENGDCDYGELEFINGALFDKINDAANEAVLSALNEDREADEKLEFDDVDWCSMSYDFCWPDELLNAAGVEH